MTGFGDMILKEIRTGEQRGIQRRHEGMILGLSEWENSGRSF